LTKISLKPILTLSVKSLRHQRPCLPAEHGTKIEGLELNYH
jgi:hypothetical protein